jgi:phosphohistidine phosphatase SixA
VRLYLIRHAHALGIAPGGDPHRTLSPAGHARAAALAEAFSAGTAPFDIRPRRLFASRAVRAEQTASPIARALSIAIESDPRLGLSASAELTEQLIAELIAAETPAAVLIGHNPDLSTLAHRFGGRHLAPGEVFVADARSLGPEPRVEVIAQA